MHSYFRAIGFSNFTSKKDQNKLLSIVLNKSNNQQEFLIGNNNKLVQINYEFGENIGITVIGEYDSKGTFTTDHYFPYCLGIHNTEQPDIQIEGYAEKEAYSAISENYNLGITLIYYVQNILDIETLHYVNIISNRNIPVKLGALSLDAKILYNVNLDHISCPYDKQPISNQDRRKLIFKAKSGDLDALEHLTLDDMDTYSLLSKRIKNEDLYTVIETYFMPYGINNERYSILGIIKNVKKIINDLSNEIVYNISVICNDIIIDIAINSRDLEGEPVVGRRFKGIIWLQGTINYTRFS